RGLLRRGRPVRGQGRAPPRLVGRAGGGSVDRRLATSRMTRTARASSESFQLWCDRPLPAEIARVAGEQLDLILARLRGRLGTDAVHDVRKATKRLRAVVRIVRDHLGDA